MVRILWFTADWCGPCKKMKPIVDDVTANVPAVKVAVYNVDTEEGKVMMRKHGVTGVPTFIQIDEDGEPVANLVGAHPKSKFKKAFGIL